MTKTRTLPATLPLFPLPGCILLPGEILPLNVFEPRYLNMVDDARREGGHIGIIQPQTNRATHQPSGQPPLRRVGTAGHIKSFVETRDGRYLLTLDGICRFTLDAETDAAAPYRTGRVDYTRYVSDLVPRPPLAGNRPRLIALLRAWLGGEPIQLDWTGVDAMPLEALVDRLAMLAPMPAEARQGLLEAPDSAARLARFESLITTLIAGRASGTVQ
ncbi:LON peptidase substrate-binding domain-containing protein [uncultured Maricaulis sp.]|uniref:LON peptidase substrate-binding domain-containing protein n=1 Tax=uncultured Maricaulis sp. TaxID=174710 RepID=UPI0030DD4990|tara:strand:+ start:83214 stop:83861 length:648 start_codon:yes stop_codon:yes gene_type:complete